MQGRDGKRKLSDAAVAVLVDKLVWIAKLLLVRLPSPPFPPVVGVWRWR